VTLASITVGPFQFDQPVWLWLIPIGWAVVVWFGRASLSGLGTWTRRAALIVRLIVIAILAGAMAEPQWRNQSKAVDVTVIVDASRSIPARWLRDGEQYIEEARRVNPNTQDQLGVITVAASAYVQQLPSKLATKVERQFIGPDQSTNLAEGVRLALGVRNLEEAAGRRLVLISDGNETAGSVLSAAEAARAMNIPIDVLPVTYSSEGEVVVDQLVAPSTARVGENINLKVVVQSTKATRGRINLLLNGTPIDLDPTTEGLGQMVDLKPGSNVFTVPVTVPKAGPQEWKAVFESIPGVTADAIAENNQQAAVTFVASEGRVLIMTESPDEAQPLVTALEQAKVTPEVVTAEQVPKSLTEMNAYDAIVLFNEPAYSFSQQTQEELKQYVHETGGGLLMIGGPASFGAGGWIGSPLEDALPVKLDPPQKRQMPRGALAIITHSIEMPDGVNFGKKTARAAVDALSRLDLVSLIEFDGSAAVRRFPIAEVGDGTAVGKAIQNLAFGDMPDYNAPMALALQELAGVQAGIKHVILITDGDAQPPTPRLIQQFNKERITVSTVAVYPHWPNDLRKLQAIADATKGRHYEVTTTAGLGNIVQIFIKEAQTVKRSLIWEGDPFIPAVTAGGVETMRGISGVPAISGYVVTAEREGLTQVTIRGKENDPIAAQWQYGLGRVLAFTSDATSRWDSAWVGWDGYKAFWEQHLRWVMRPSGNANMRVTTEKAGDQTKIVLDAIDAQGERMNFAKFRTRVAAPDGTGQDVELKQTGPGRYEAIVDTKLAGSYVVSMRYAAPQAGPNGEVKTVEGSVQAAISRPFADEFRATTDNAPLLQQVAKMTGGRVLSGVPTNDDLWSREGVKMPVATKPVWLAFALAGITLFLLDVAVRRVRIDIPAMARAVARGFSASRARAGQQIGALQKAREAAREQMAKRGAGQEAVDPATLRTAATQASAKVKFEAAPDRIRKRDASPVIEGGTGSGPAKPAPAAQKKDVPKEEGLSRLMQAKKRAREDMDE
jgi:uncharacterized membrane protein